MKPSVVSSCRIPILRQAKAEYAKLAVGRGD
jgi:hypothetical protein